MHGPNADLAAALSEVARLLRARRADRFRVRAYERAARVAAAAPVPLSALPPERLRRLEGIGSAMAALVAEHARTGRLALLDDLRDGEPEAVGALASLPLIGVRDARRLVSAGFASIADLRVAAEGDTELEGLDQRLVARVRESFRRLPAATDPRRPLPSAAGDARAVAAALEQVDGVAEVIVAGDVRRGVSLVGELTLVVVLRGGTSVAVAEEALVNCRAVVTVLEHGRGTGAQPGVTTTRILTPSGHPAELWLTAPEFAGSALLVATGPQGHVEDLARRAESLGLVISADGLRPLAVRSDQGRGSGPAQRVAGRDEAEVYRALGLAPVPPELRASTCALQQAADGTLPALVRAGDLRGDLHLHSDFSGDGVDSLAEMVRGAAGRGYDYVAITDHAENLRINGMTVEVVEHRRRTIAELQRRHRHVRILDAAELNIDLDGGLDYDLEGLLRFDLGVASIHSHMDRDRAAQTERVLAAVQHPAVHVIGHPTGRIIGRRPGYELDLAAIAEAAAETGTALEVNGSPARLDLDGPMVAAALAAGAVLSLASDAHSLEELSYVENAVLPARAGGATAADVLNARDLDGLLAFAEAKRRRAG